MKRALFITAMLTLLSLFPAMVLTASDKAGSPANETNETVAVIQYEDGSIRVTVVDVQEVTACNETELREKYPDVYKKYIVFLADHKIDEAYQKALGGQPPQTHEIDEQYRDKIKELEETLQVFDGLQEFGDKLTKAVREKQDCHYTLKVGNSEYSLTAIGNWKSEEIGITVESVSAALEAQLEIKGGILITDIAEGGLAAKAGLKQYDVLVSIGDTEVPNIEKLATALGTITAETEVTCKIIRQAQKQELKMTIPPQSKETTQPFEPDGKP